MVNKDIISVILACSIGGEDFKIRQIHIKGYGDRKIGTESLQNALFEDDKYVDDFARQVDEGIFFYVEDKAINYSDKQLAEYVLKAMS